VGYGASPQEVSDRIRQRAWPRLRGNHEDMLGDFSIVDGRGMLKKRARASIEWTREVLGPERVAELAGLPRALRPAPDVLAVHGSLVDPNFCYAYIYDLSLDLNIRRLHELATPPGTLVLHGHTHWPKVFRVTEGGEWRDLKIGEGEVGLDREARYFVNPGSVGHPRDGDPRASLMVWDPAGRRLEHVRLEYDIETTLGRIRAAGYSEEIVERWVE
jgi:diadenosine tetraphosphatase ApaH/serine/threonine PP2A family protein phosphatase